MRSTDTRQRALLTLAVILLALASTAVIVRGSVLAERRAQQGAVDPRGDGGSTPDASVGAPDVAACSATLRRDLDGVIAAQLDAFAADDYASALALASESFRATLDERRFRQVITSEYPVVARAATHTSTDCLTIDGAVQMLVQVEAADGERVDLVYALLLEDGTWHIAGAVPAAAAGTPAPDDLTSA